MDLDQIKFDKDGLVPVIVQDAADGEVLMMAYMNRLSLEKTLSTRETWFWSRSRQEFWHKGETSGNTQKVEEIYYDCDADTFLMKVTQKGAACHEGYRTCFHNLVNQDGTVTVVGEKMFDPQKVYG
jgi:phosphoribosyl-AMP cyclohydrolase